MKSKNCTVYKSTQIGCQFNLFKWDSYEATNHIVYRQCIIQGIRGKRFPAYVLVPEQFQCWRVNSDVPPMYKTAESSGLTTHTANSLLQASPTAENTNCYVDKKRNRNQPTANATTPNNTKQQEVLIGWHVTLHVHYTHTNTPTQTHISQLEVLQFHQIIRPEMPKANETKKTHFWNISAVAQLQNGNKMGEGRAWSL